MAIAPNAATSRVSRVSPDDQATQVIPRVRPPSLVRPLLKYLLPALLLALVAGAVAGRTQAPVLGAALGVAGAAVALWVGIRRADRA